MRLTKIRAFQTGTGVHKLHKVLSIAGDSRLLNRHTSSHLAELDKFRSRLYRQECIFPGGKEYA